MPDNTPLMLNEAIERLCRRQRFGIKPGLERTRSLLTALGHPEQAFAALHVAGTNGKGSVCALADAILRAAGLPCGLYTSPHLVRFNERIRLNGAAIADERLADLIPAIESLSDEVASATGDAPTFFECGTALAFAAFRDAGIKLAVVETGLGGRLDATNAVLPLACAITRVSLDHMEYLGRDVASIATEKAGIIKPGRPVVAGDTDPAARAVIAARARAVGAPLRDAAATVRVERINQSLAGQRVRAVTAEADYGTLSLPLLGRHQLENLATALALCEEAARVLGLTLDPAAVRRGVAATRWPGRLDVLRAEPPLIADGAHNPGAANVLATAIKELLGRRPLGVILGMCGDKDSAGFLRELAPRVRRAWAVPLRHERGLAPATLAALAQTAGWTATPAASLAEARVAADAWCVAEGGAVLVTGSLFLVGELLEDQHG